MCLGIAPRTARSRAFSSPGRATTLRLAVFRINTCTNGSKQFASIAQSWCNVSTFRINTCGTPSGGEKQYFPPISTAGLAQHLSLLDATLMRNIGGEGGLVRPAYP